MIRAAGYSGGAYVVQEKQRDCSVHLLDYSAPLMCFG